MSDIAIRVENLSKRYRIGQRERYYALRDVLARALTAPFCLFSRNERQAAASNPSGYIWALKDVSFEVKEGEIVGIIGRNGAGKTTLLKILARITKPTKGYAEVRGRVGSLLEVGVGFHPELTGRENIYLSGAILGMTKQEIDRKFDEIVTFAGVEQFLDTPLKHYSTGMQMRLAFAVAAHLEPEILLVDEVLAVGDLEFQKKCLGKMEEVSRSGRTVLFVSHQMNQIRRLCERVIWIDEGRIKKDGPTNEVVLAYEKSLSTFIETNNGESKKEDVVQFIGWELVNTSTDSSYVLTHLGPVSFKVMVYVFQEISNGIYSILLFDDNGNIIWHANKLNIYLKPGFYEFVHHLPMLPLRPGLYRWKAGIYDGHRWIGPWWGYPELYVATEYLTHTSDEFAGILNLPYEIEIKSIEG
jgi:ABC-type polysaccharide/polyol phosphate transport system ATPase subunit